MNTLIKSGRNFYQKTERGQRIIASIAALLVLFASVGGLTANAADHGAEKFCGYVEHIHDDSCFTEHKTLVCGLAEEEHEHTDECFEVTLELSCEKEEHTHSQECFSNPECFSDPEAEEAAPAPASKVTMRVDPPSPAERFYPYALEFSVTDDEGNTTNYATADVKKISVAEIAEQLGLTGEITAVDGNDPTKCYYTEEETDGWYLYTVQVLDSIPSDPYTGELFGGLPALYYSQGASIVITIGGAEQTVEMRYIATPIQLNDPGAVDGVTVGDTIYTFASGMPLSTVYIDNTHFETATSWEKLTDEPGFVFRVPTEFMVDAAIQDFDGEKKWAIYDPGIQGATQLDSTKENYFEGPLFSYTYENAAILSDGSVANVRITYSDAYITIDKRATSGFPHSILLAYGKHLRTASSDNTEALWRSTVKDITKLMEPASE